MLYNGTTELGRAGNGYQTGGERKAMEDRQVTEWYLYLDDSHFPDYLLVKATGALNGAFYVRLLADLEAFMAAKVGVRARYTPLIFDLRACFPTREGLDTLLRLVRRGNCRASHIILWISQTDVNGPVLHSVALMLKSMLPGIHIIGHMDEAYGLLGIPMPEERPVGRRNLLNRFARLSI